MNKLEPKSNLYDRFRASILVLQDLEGIVETGDRDERQFAQEEILNEKSNFTQLSQEAVFELIPQDEYDDCSSITVEVRPGVGGSESSLFAEDMINMIQNYSVLVGW